jgi:hypothetical protein
MSTPQKQRRYDAAKAVAQFNNDVVGIALQPSIRNADYAFAFAQLVSEFTHLEATIGRLLAVLLRIEDSRSQIAHYIWRTIINAETRIAVLRTLLEEAHFNEDQPDELDGFIAEFEQLKSRRNAYVHGQWYTRVDTGQMLLAKPRAHPHGFGAFTTKPLPLAELDETLARIRKLNLDVLFYLRDRDEEVIARVTSSAKERAESSE